ncbi:hypothetical protein AB0K05_24765 [Nonomuraea sp. NPDC049486]|uniref:hypothetical protein n=1 Tax=Nonomuraea sp. NPDC049486 TaxID=3155773 RepID=UPI0034409D04
MSDFVDSDGDKLKIERPLTYEGRAFVTIEGSGGGVYVSAADLPMVVAALYQAAGQQPPLIARRVYFGDNPKLHEKLRVAVNGVLVERKGHRLHLFGREFDVTTAEMIAGALLELVEAATAEPDPELLAALSETLDGALGGEGLFDTELLARDVLAAYKVEKRRQP